MHKSILALLLSFLSCVYAAELAPVLEQLSISPVLAPNPTKSMSFKDVQELSKAYNPEAPDKRLRMEIINGLNSLMQRRDLKKDKENNEVVAAEVIADKLNAPTLLMRLQTVGHEGENLGGLPPEIMRIILEKVSEGVKAEKVLAFLTVSKGFNRLLLETPLALDLSPYGEKVTDDFIRTIVTLFPNLKSLDLEGCNITDAGLASLASLTQLQFLSLEGCNISDAGLAQLAPLTQLQELNLMFCRRITEKGLGYLSLLTHLKSLNLANCIITDKGLAQLAPLSQLQDLNLMFCRGVTQKRLEHISLLTQLQDLDLSFLTITDAGLAQLTSLTHLKSLTLAHCTITDAGLAQLAPLIHLESLDLSNCNNIKDEGLVPLASLTQLQFLNLEGCPKVTLEKIYEIMVRVPGIKILPTPPVQLLQREEVTKLVSFKFSLKGGMVL